jgi:hypothetical protein
MTTKRKLAVKEGRAMIRVRYIKTREPATVGVCPACWNIPQRRAVLLQKLKKMGLEVTFRDDLYEGLYFTDKSHAPGCPYSKMSPDPWKRFESSLKKKQVESTRSAPGKF